MLQEILNIDSRDRNTNIFTNSNYFNVQLSNPLKKLKSIELLSAEIPVSFNNVNTNNNLFSFQTNVSGTISKYEIHIPVGTYTLPSFCSALELAINNHLGSAVFSIAYDSNKNSVQMLSTISFFIANDTTCNKIIGFQTAANYSTTWESTLACDIIYEKYICIKLNNIPFLNYNSNNNYFAKVQLPAVNNSISYGSLYSGYPQKRRINNDNFILTSIDIELCFRNGERVDLRGLDWSFSLLIEFEEQ